MIYRIIDLWKNRVHKQKKQEKINNLLVKIDYNCTTLRLQLNKNNYKKTFKKMQKYNGLQQKLKNQIEL
tara:strand:+ start:578 stop:784 length:207 start_codon:yes stop_codon:yes gene_type:complete